MHPSYAACCGTITVHCKLLPSHSAVVVRSNPPLMGEKCPAQSHILPRASASCAYKVKYTAEKVARSYKGEKKKG